MAVRFYRHVVMGANGCHLWTGSLDKDGYGNFRPSVEVSRKRAHRVAYEMIHGPIPDGLPLDHLCKIRHCVNPLHAEPVTVAENNRRSDCVSTVNAALTHCRRGHAFDSANTYEWRGHRHCRRCTADRAARYRNQ